MLIIKIKMLISYEAGEAIEKYIARQLEEHPHFLCVPENVNVESIPEEITLGEAKEGACLAAICFEEQREE